MGPLPLSPFLDVGEQLKYSSAQRLIAAGAKLYTNGRLAYLSLHPLSGYAVSGNINNKDLK